MAIATATIATSRTTVVKAWRKVASDVSTGFNFTAEEVLDLIEKVPTDGTPWSAREVLNPIDLNEGYGIASISEGDYDSTPSAVNLEETTVDVVQFNGRFNASKLAKYGDKGSVNQLEKQLFLMASKKVQAMNAHIADYFYGYPTAVLATTNTDVSGTTGTLTLAAGYDSTITDANFICRKFKVGDVVALVAAGSDALVDANAIGTITAVTPATPSIAVTFIGSVSSYTTDGIRIVKANSMNQVIGGTDLNKGYVGVLAGLKTASVHSLTHTNWTTAYSNTSGGRFSSIKLRRMKDEIQNYGDGKLNMVIMDQAVYRDAVDLQLSALRFNDPSVLSIDGDIDAKGVKIFTSRRALPGYAIGLDRTCMKRWMLTDKPDENVSWSDGKEYIDQNAFVFGMDVVSAILWKNRKKTAYYSGLTTS